MCVFSLLYFFVLVLSFEFFFVVLTFLFLFLFFFFFFKIEHFHIQIKQTFLLIERLQLPPPFFPLTTAHEVLARVCNGKV